MKPPAEGNSAESKSAESKSADGSSIEIAFEGRRIAARRGESLAAALTGDGVRVLRSNRSGDERGLFCGMGVCHDCIVEVDGYANQRSCMTKVDRPMQVRREAHGRPPLPAAAAEAAPNGGAAERLSPDILVIGAGPGGLSAALAAQRAGAEVLVVDERSQAGGQYFKQLAVEGPGIAPADRQHSEGRALIEAALAAGVVFRSGCTVWGGFDPGLFAASDAAGALEITPRATIVATGAYERGWPVPGWTLPGVMTTGAAQTLWRTARRLPGKRVLIAGNGPLNLQLAAELIAGGADIVAVAEAAARPGLASAGLLLEMVRSAPELVGEGVRYHARRRAAGTPMLYGTRITGIEATASGLKARVASPSGERTFEVDAVCLGYGFEPASELLRALGCGHDYDPERRQLAVRRDARGLTDVAGIYALGDCTGLGGARLALAEGVLVGLAAAEALGRPITAALRAEATRAQAARGRHRRFQRALWQLYAAPAYDWSLATPETLLCRCEEVTFGQIEAALSENMREIGAVKRRTRIGMGRCQGRYCAPLLDAFLADRFGRPRDEFTGFAPRIPVKPVAIEDIARLAP